MLVCFSLNSNHTRDQCIKMTRAGGLREAWEVSAEKETFRTPMNQDEEMQSNNTETS